MITKVNTKGFFVGEFTTHQGPVTITHVGGEGKRGGWRILGASHGFVMENIGRVSRQSIYYIDAKHVIKAKISLE